MGLIYQKNVIFQRLANLDRSESMFKHFVKTLRTSYDPSRPFLTIFIFNPPYGGAQRGLFCPNIIEKGHFSKITLLGSVLINVKHLLMTLCIIHDHYVAF